MNLIHHYFELAAAIVGSFYWLQTKDSKIVPFLWFLWLTITVETVALYGYVMMNNYDAGWFMWIKNSPICKNTWLYNIYGFVGLILLGMFYTRILNETRSKQIVKAIVVSCSLFAIAYFLISGRFFETYLPYDDVVRTFAIFAFVLLYFRELLKTDEVLWFYKSHIFYISVALILWHISITPLFIFDGYFREMNATFVDYRHNHLLTSNIILYSCYVFAFLLALYFKGKLVPKKLH